VKWTSHKPLKYIYGLLPNCRKERQMCSRCSIVCHIVAMFNPSLILSLTLYYCYDRLEQEREFKNQFITIIVTMCNIIIFTWFLLFFCEVLYQLCISFPHSNQYTSHIISASQLIMSLAQPVLPVGQSLMKERVDCSWTKYIILSHGDIQWKTGI